MSGLTKKSVYADKLLATVLGVKEGDRVSYADLTRGLHKYIKDHDLKNPHAVAAPASVPPVASGPPAVVPPVTPTVTKACGNCGAEIPTEAVFCDVCGARQ